MTDETFTYKTFIDRCTTAANEITPDLPTAGGRDAWEDFLETLEDFEVGDAAWEEVDGWDWSIYTHYGMKIINILPSDDLNEAEAQWHELDGPSCRDESFGVYEFAAKVAYFAMVAKVTELAQATIEELKELAETQLENMGG